MTIEFIFTERLWELGMGEHFFYLRRQQMQKPCDRLWLVWPSNRLDREAKQSQGGENGVQDRGKAGSCRCWPHGEPSINASCSQSPKGGGGAVGLQTIWLKHCVTPQVGTSFIQSQVLRQALVSLPGYTRSCLLWSRRTWHTTVSTQLVWALPKIKTVLKA